METETLLVPSHLIAGYLVLFPPTQRVLDITYEDV